MRPDDVPTSCTTRIAIEDKTRKLNRYELSELGIGQRDVVLHSYSSGNRSRSTSTSTRMEDIMAVSQISALPKWQGLLLVTGRPVAIVAMVPWFGRRAPTKSPPPTTGLHALTERANTPAGVS